MKCVNGVYLLVTIVMLGLGIKHLLFSELDSPVVAYGISVFLSLNLVALTWWLINRFRGIDDGPNWFSGDSGGSGGGGGDGGC